MPNQLLFLPGASGNIQFWAPVSKALTYQARMIHVGWPGFGPTPPSSEVQEFNDLVNLVVQQLAQRGTCRKQGSIFPFHSRNT